MVKPPYRVPSMAEIAALPPSGLKVVSTFAGAGGSSLGYRMAGYRVLWASEFIDAARQVYEANAAPGTIVDGRDIREVDPLEVLRALRLKPGELDVLDGSPPCASFSTAGKREKHWGESKKYSDKAQRTDDLFFEFIRFLGAMKPRAFVAENVSGLIKGTAKGYFLEILAAMKASGYRVEARLLDAQWLGVPQARQRVIFVGVRADLDVAPAFPSPLPHRYSVRDALPWIGRAVHDTAGKLSFSSGNITNRPAPTVMVNSRHFQVVDEASRKIGSSDSVPEDVGASLDGYAIGREYDKLNPGQSSDKFFNLVRADASKPCPSITAQGAGVRDSPGVPGSTASVCHPTERRKFSIAELKRICAFPDDFVLSGSYAQQWERLGRAVPPLMMKMIAEAVRDGVLGKAKDVRPGRIIPASETRHRPSPRRDRASRP